MNKGVIQIDRKLWEKIGSPSLRDVSHALLLPDDYHVVGVVEDRVSPIETVVKVYVVSGLIIDSLGIVELKPVYRREDGETFFDHMETMGKGE